MTFQDLVTRNTTLYNKTYLIRYDADTEYLDMPTIFTLTNTNIENISQKGANSSPTPYPGTLFYIVGSSLLRVHGLYLRHVYAVRKNSYVSKYLILNRFFSTILPSEPCLF